MKRGTPLRRYAPLRAKAGLKRTPFATKPASTPTSTPARVRYTGPSRETRGMVLARDNFQCVACGKPVGGACTWWSIQHRVARGQGGGNEAWNLILLCGSATSPGCHGLCESRDREMQARGYWLESWQDPSREPVMVMGEDGGVTVWLSVDGEYLTEMPGDVA